MKEGRELHGFELRLCMDNSGFPTFRIADEMGISEYELRKMYSVAYVPKDFENSFFDAIDRLKAKERKKV